MPPPVVARPRSGDRRTGVEADADAPTDAPALPPLELDQLRDAWQRSVVEAVKTRSIPISTLLAEARPVEISRATP